MSKILVCGSEGSLMQAVIPKLLMTGHEVFGADNLMRHGNRLGLTNPSDYVFYKADLTNANIVYELMDIVKPDYVIQAAAQIYGVGGFNKYCADILGKDLILHNNVLASAIDHSVKRVIYISSSMVYEGCPQVVDFPVWEDMINYHPAPATDYGLSKFVGERMSKAYKREYGLPYTIWRPFNIITPYEKAETDIGFSHVFADFVENIVIKKKNPLPIIGNGDQIRCFTWIDEVAEAIEKFSFEDITENQIFNLGNPEPISMRELAKKIHSIAANEFGVDLERVLSFKTVTSFPNDVMVRVPSMEKTEKILDWKAKVKVADSIRKCLNVALTGSQI